MQHSDYEISKNSNPDYEPIEQIFNENSFKHNDSGFQYHMPDQKISTPILEEIGLESRTDDREELITIIVEISEGREETIIVHNGDTAEELAEKFALKHNLNEHMKSKLRDNIQANINEILKEISEEQYENTGSININPENIQDDDNSEIPQAEVANSVFMGKKMSERDLPKVDPLDVETQRKKSDQIKLTENAKFVIKNTELKNSYSNNEMPSSPKEFIEPVRAKTEILTPAKSHSIIEIEKSHSRIINSCAKSGKDIGERLYQKGMRVKAEKERLYEEARKERSEQEDEHFSFKPEINKKSKQILNKSAIGKISDRPEERLLAEGKQKQERMEALQTYKKMEEQLKCPFKPEVDKKSAKLADSRSRMVSAINSTGNEPWISKDKFEFLFEDAKRRQNHHNRLEKLAPHEECTFHPNIETSQRNSLCFSSGKKPAISRNKNLQQNETAPVVDEKTGQPLFKPKTGRAPKILRNDAKLPIGEYLYAQNNKKTRFLNVLKEEEENKIKEIHNSSHVQQESKKMVESRKISGFNNLFSLLDNDSDGIISARNIDISSIFFRRIL